MDTVDTPVKKIAQFESLIEGRDDLKAIVYYHCADCGYKISFFRNDVYIEDSVYETDDKVDALSRASWFVSYDY